MAYTVRDLFNQILNADETAIATTDRGMSQTSSYTYTTSADMTTAADITAAPTSGEKIVVTDVIISTDTATLFSFKEETSGTVIGAVDLSADSPIQITPRGKWKLATADKKLQGQAGDAANIYITVFYYSEE